MSWNYLVKGDGQRIPGRGFSTCKDPVVGRSMRNSGDERGPAVQAELERAIRGRTCRA